MSKLRSDQNFYNIGWNPKKWFHSYSDSWFACYLILFPPLFLIEGGANIYQTDTGYDPFPNGRDGF